jgi:carboxypeptidase Q
VWSSRFLYVFLSILFLNTSSHLLAQAQGTKQSSGGQPSPFFTNPRNVLQPTSSQQSSTTQAKANKIPYADIRLLDSAYMHKTYSETAKKIIAHALKDSLVYKRLQYMCDTFGPRLSGTPGLERAIDWTLQELKKDGFENVRGEEVKVPAWRRGEESCELLLPRPQKLPMLGLGGSIATPKGGITAQVLVVKNFADLKKRCAEAKGKIVLFNVPFTQYRQTVIYRSEGAIRAAECGAVASLIRSVASYSMQSPHTGGMRYQDSVQRIPHAAISVEDAEMLARMQERGDSVVVRLSMNAESLPDVISRNVIAEIKGREKADEIVVMGGHIDSWDVGTGAMDDAGGCFATWKALQILKELGLKPRRTLRLALWTNEENGLRGGIDYAAQHGKEKHILAFESDGGVFKPQGFGFTGAPELLKTYSAAATLLAPVSAATVSVGGGGADISPLIEYGVPQMSILVDGTKYFWYHHTTSDTPDKLDPHEINQCAAAIAVMMFIAADLP